MSKEEKKECGCNHEHCNHEHDHEHCNHEHCNHEHGECNHEHKDGHECCCGHHHNEALQSITLVDESGVEHTFYHLDTVEYKDEQYVVLQPAEKIEGIEDDEVLIYLLNTKGDEDELVPIEDEDLLNTVFDEWVKDMEDDN